MTVTLHFHGAAGTVTGSCYRVVHPGGQFLYGVTGRGWIRSRDDEGAWLEPGDVLWVAPGEWHFHSAGPDTPLVHVAVNGGGAPDWGERVTDDEYAQGRS